jgi:hypothetical protein
MVMGVLMPVNPAYRPASFGLLPFQQAWCWGKWRESPLLHEQATMESLTDIALCKLPELGDGSAYQPLQLSLHPFSPGEEAYAIGYAEMGDIPIEYVGGNPVISVPAKPGERGKRHDVVMHVLSKVTGDERAAAREAAIRDAGTAWLVRKASAARFRVDPSRLHIDGYDRVRIPRSDARPVLFSTLTFQGVLSMRG